MSRDRTARARITQFLAVHGAIEHDQGKATAALMEAIGYEGHATAFIQLLAAMDRDGEIERETRGKRTYKITGVARPGVTARIGGGAEDGVDYDELARALLRETWRVLADSSGPSRAEFEQLRAERDQLLEERTRLQARFATFQHELLGAATVAAPTHEQVAASPTESEVDHRARELLAKLVGGQQQRAERAG
jgi:hypothetical protein